MYQNELMRKSKRNSTQNSVEERIRSRTRSKSRSKSPKVGSKHQSTASNKKRSTFDQKLMIEELQAGFDVTEPMTKEQRVASIQRNNKLIMLQSSKAQTTDNDYLPVNI